MLYLLYRLATWIALPFLPLFLFWRKLKGKEHPKRMGERFGFTSTARPEGKLIWVHAASVGEMNTALPLITALGEQLPNAHFLLTTVTVTSAKLVESKLPLRTIHQFAPLDAPPVIERFLKHWQPTSALFMESELWPNMIVETHQTGASLFIINGRMSDGSYRMWLRFAGTARYLMAAFTMVYAQSNHDAEKFHTLGAKTGYIGNLKYDTPPLPVDEATLTKLQSQIGNRPVWLAASTHPGEEELIVQTHKQINIPDLLTIIVPRHAVRGPEIAKNLNAALRSRGDVITPSTSIYIADTMGELGLFYRLCKVVFIGGSLVPHGGQNLIEPAQLGCAILCGPHMHNFAEVAEEFAGQHAITRITNTSELANHVYGFLSDKTLLEKQIQSSLHAATQYKGLTQRLADELIKQPGLA